MTRPASIVRFERLYWASFVIGLVGTAMGWAQRQATIAANPALASTAGWLLPAIATISALVTVALWYLIARRGSVVAKWILVVLTAILVLGGIGTLLALGAGRSPNALVSLLSLADVALSVAAVAMLFRPDARPWFGEPEPTMVDEVQP